MVCVPVQLKPKLTSVPGLTDPDVGHAGKNPKIGLVAVAWVKVLLLYTICCCCLLSYLTLYETTGVAGS